MYLDFHRSLYALMNVILQPDETVYVAAMIWVLHTAMKACNLQLGRWRSFANVCCAMQNTNSRKNCTKIIQKAIIFQSPTQQAYPITLEILYYEIDRKTVLLVISLLKSFTQTIDKSLKWTSTSNHKSWSKYHHMIAMT